MTKLHNSNICIGQSQADPPVVGLRKRKNLKVSGFVGDLEISGGKKTNKRQKQYTI